MTDVEIQDRGGAMMKLREVDGWYSFPGMTRKRWSGLKSLKIRESDVFLCAYPRSGFHWVWEIVTMLKKGDATLVNDYMEKHFLDSGPLRRFDSLPTPRVMTTHRYFDDLPDDVIQKRCKIVYLLREPKDVCVSFYHLILKIPAFGYDGQFEDFMQLFLDGKVIYNAWTQHILKWSHVKRHNPLQPVLVVHYEDMKQFPEREIRRLADFLEVKTEDRLIRDIVINTDFASFKAAKDSVHNPLTKFYKGNKDIMHRKGETGDWRNWFSEQRQREFDNNISIKLDGHDFDYLSSVKRGMASQEMGLSKENET